MVGREAPTFVLVKGVEMAGKSPNGKTARKPAKLTLKEKRAAKRAKSEDASVNTKLRKGA